MSGPVRRNVAHLTDTEREEFAQALRDVDMQTYADGVSFWDKQDQIHEGTHNHGGNSFVPWHRELVNRFEKLIQQVNPDMAMHYWDWTQDPRAADDGQGGTVNLCTDATLGTANGTVVGTLGSLHNSGNATGARPSFGGPFTSPPVIITRRSLSRVGCRFVQVFVWTVGLLIQASVGGGVAVGWPRMKRSGWAV